MAVPICITLEINSDLVVLYKGTAPVVPRFSETVQFPYKGSCMSATVLSVTHDLEAQLVTLLVEELKEERSATGMTASGSCFTLTN